MNDELPTEERLRRIERGVQRRIDLRRLAARRVAVGAAAVLIVAGGAALFRPVLATTTSSGAAGSAAEEPAFGPAASSTGVEVRCHGTRTVTAAADPAALPASALVACARAERGASTSSLSEGEATGTGATPSAIPSPSAASTLCRAEDGVLHVYPGLPAACAQHGMHPYPG